LVSKFYRILKYTFVKCLEEEEQLVKFFHKKYEQQLKSKSQNGTQGINFTAVRTFLRIETQTCKDFVNNKKLNLF